MLFDAAQEPKAYWEIPDRGHIQALRDAAVRKRLAGFLLDQTLDRPTRSAKGLQRSTYQGRL